MSAFIGNEDKKSPRLPVFMKQAAGNIVVFRQFFTAT
jgi:hypothetical protein